MFISVTAEQPVLVESGRSLLKLNRRVFDDRAVARMKQSTSNDCHHALKIASDECGFCARTMQTFFCADLSLDSFRR